MAHLMSTFMLNGQVRGKSAAPITLSETPEVKRRVGQDRGLLCSAPHPGNIQRLGGPSLIDTSLQRGDGPCTEDINRFSGFSWVDKFPQAEKTAEAVGISSEAPGTPLKRGVNERSLRKVSNLLNRRDRLAPHPTCFTHHASRITLRASRLLALCFLFTVPFVRAGSIHAGPLLDDFDLTLTLGHRTEAAGPFFYEQDQAGQYTVAVPPLFSLTRDPASGLKEYDFLYPVLTYDRYGEQYRWQFFQLLSFAGGPSQSATNRNRFTLFPFYFQQRASDPAENYTALFPLYGHLQQIGR